MNKVLITILLLCTAIVTAGCEKTYSVAEFKKNPQLMDEWGTRCGFTGTSKNCENLRLAALELQKEYKAKAEERWNEAVKESKRTMDKLRAKQEADNARRNAEVEKLKAEFEKRQAEEKAKEQAEREAEERAKAQQQQDNN
ncbi:EexN family lipoprotein [Bartonella rattaustraliani]|uniref:EexN family lipoprotein n=1 Tax=Bartonella rattaustraliani TaxID=481139 RepID=UPI0002FF165C|nr:EexN family lipoprotein [Bartonella rattaustraliani]